MVLVLYVSCVTYLRRLPRPDVVLFSCTHFLPKSRTIAQIPFDMSLPHGPHITLHADNVDFFVAEVYGPL